MRLPVSWLSRFLWNPRGPATLFTAPTSEDAAIVVVADDDVRGIAQIKRRVRHVAPNHGTGGHGCARVYVIAPDDLYVRPDPHVIPDGRSRALGRRSDVGQPPNRAV